MIFTTKIVKFKKNVAKILMYYLSYIFIEHLCKLNIYIYKMRKSMIVQIKSHLVSSATHVAEDDASCAACIARLLNEGYSVGLLEAAQDLATGFAAILSN